MLTAGLLLLPALSQAAPSPSQCPKNVYQTAFFEAHHTHLDIHDPDACSRYRQDTAAFVEIQSEAYPVTPVPAIDPFAFDKDADRVFWCPDCITMLDGMVEWCEDPKNFDNLENFCTEKFQGENRTYDPNTPWPSPVGTHLYGPLNSGTFEKCQSAVKCMYAIYCPNSPCERLKFEAGHVRRALCDHQCLNCINPSCNEGLDFADASQKELKLDNPEKCTYKTCDGVTHPYEDQTNCTIECGSCENFVRELYNWCEDPEKRGWILPHNISERPDLPGFCEEYLQNETAKGNQFAMGPYNNCLKVRQALSDMFFPENFCDGMKCVCPDSYGHPDSPKQCDVCSTALKCARPKSPPTLEANTLLAAPPGVPAASVNSAEDAAAANVADILDPVAYAESMLQHQRFAAEAKTKKATKQQ